jgi:hypothetical protein
MGVTMKTIITTPTAKIALIKTAARHRHLAGGGWNYPEHEGREDA